jgi:hypothetical protein
LRARIDPYIAKKLKRTELAIEKAASNFGISLDMRDQGKGQIKSRRQLVFRGLLVPFEEERPAGNNLSGTLTVTDGSHTAHITLLGGYSPSQFTSASDGHSGTVITDPPASAPVLWASTPDADGLLWHPTTSDARTGRFSAFELRGSGATTPVDRWQGQTVDSWSGGDPAGFLWQPTTSLASVDPLVGGSFLGQSIAAYSPTMHPPFLGG